MFACPAGLFECIEVARQALNFFADVGALGEDRHFFDQITFVHAELGLAHQLIHALREALVVVVDDKRGALGYF